MCVCVVITSEKFGVSGNHSPTEMQNMSMLTKYVYEEVMPYPKVVETHQDEDKMRFVF